MTDGLTLFSGAAYRIIFAGDEPRVLDGAKSAEGRFHFDGMRAFYASPRADWAFKAVEAYLKPDDPARVVAQLRIEDARLVDLRCAVQCGAFGIEARDAAVPWLPQLARGERPDTWRVTERVIKSGADGFIYTARSAPERWHLMLLRWNKVGARVSVSGFSRFEDIHTVSLQSNGPLHNP